MNLNQLKSSHKDLFCTNIYHYYTVNEIYVIINNKVIFKR